MKNIVLIGMPSAGKSTVGIILAKTLGMSFVDTDIVIQENSNMLLQEIIDTQGIKSFLSIEESSILSIRCKKSIIATGGSVIYSSKAMEYLKQEGIVIYFKIDFAEMSRRLDNISTRGIALDKNQSIFDMYNQRVPIYEKYADITVDCSQKDVEEIINSVIDEIKRGYLKND